MPQPPSATDRRPEVATEPVLGPVGGDEGLACPRRRALRERLRAMAADVVAPWRSHGIPAGAKSAAALRRQAEGIVERAGGAPSTVGWTMVTIVSEFWRHRLAAVPPGRRVLLVPDCPRAVHRGSSSAAGPHVCGPGCVFDTVAVAARENGWVVKPTSAALGGIGALLTGQTDGILGIAKLSHLEKAFAMLPAFALPIAAVPIDADAAARCAAAGGTCPEVADAAALDAEWILALLGVAGGAPAPVGDYLPLLREAAALFTAPALERLGTFLGVADGLRAVATATPDGVSALDATAWMATDFLCRGGKFLRPFITLASFDAVSDDRRQRGETVVAVDRAIVHAAAVAIEVFHKASLIHDDIEDGDAMRYGRATVHVERGVPLAINAGDWLLGAGYRIVAALPGLPEGAHRDLVALLSDAHLRLARGQGGELWWRGTPGKGLRPAEALELYGLKTSPAFEAALAMGVRLAGADPAAVGDLRGYALHVGTGFQVLNDLKDWMGDAVNAREAAGDLLGGRPTVLWALAIEVLGASAVARIFDRARCGDPGEHAAALAEAREQFTRAGVFARAEAIVAAERAGAAAAAPTAQSPRLREVMEFLLDLAVPDEAVLG